MYVWDSAALLDARQRADQLRSLHKAGITHVYLGLDAVQLADSQHTFPAIRTLIKQAHGQGLAISLLLGDPSWIKPNHRQGLISLVRRMSSLPFDGLHLDLEVEQLGWPVPDKRLRDWIETVRQVKAASPWPLQLSSHPRWFAEESRRTPCVPCELQDVGVSDISLMIYTRNARRSADTAVAIARRWPGLHLRLAQSVESDQPQDLSWAGASPAQLQRQVTEWRGTLEPAGLGGIDWQEWSEFPRAR